MTGGGTQAICILYAIFPQNVYCMQFPGGTPSRRERLHEAYCPIALRFGVALLAAGWASGAVGTAEKIRIAGNFPVED
jgi:hypothetical protein